MNEVAFHSLLSDAGLEPRSYSGRGMHGEQCIGVTVNSFGTFMSRLVAQLDNDYLADWGASFGDLAAILERTAQDSMGRGIILYWPSMEWENLPASEEPEDDEEI